MADSSSELLPTGSRITVVGLAGRPEFNGLTGTVLSWDGDKGRFGVKLDAGEIGPTAKGTCERLKAQVDRQLETSAYHTVDLSTLFNACVPAA